MTTPPKATVFHTRRGQSALTAARTEAAQTTADQPLPDGATPQRPAVFLRRQMNDAPQQPESEAEAIARLTSGTPDDDGFGNFALPGSAAAERQAANTPQPMADRIAAVQAENHSPRKLRLARRIAALNGIDAASDEEAVVLLRDRGVDPFHRAQLGKILSSAGAQAQRQPAANPPARVDSANLPQTTAALGQIVPAQRQMPSREALTEERRTAEILRVQQDIARRRRRRSFMLLLRLSFFIFLPTIIAGWYYFTQASPLYATHSQFAIQSADMAGSSGGGLLGAAAINTDAVQVQGYLTSRDAMQRLDKELGFKKVFQDPDIDVLKRLPADATDEQAYGVYQNSVKVGYDPTEGVINMEVIAPSAELSETYAQTLLGYAEGQVDQLSARMRSDQMREARDNYADAEQKLVDAQIRIQTLQEQMGVMDAGTEGGMVMGQISTLEAELIKKQLELSQLMANARPNQSRVDGVRGDIARIEGLLTSTRARLTEAQQGQSSIVGMQSQLTLAQAELATRQTLLGTAAEMMEAARLEANKQVRYLSVSIEPIRPDEPAYPKAFENTLVAFLIFSGIYLMLSLTASILREQVSS
ncbi:MAG: capsule biosynthesis protein [Paracoccus sp. (in: a-proteobacteria)]|uniref:capsule biosynthesis protein n=1 Tax=Paracoccus sp. TaxID=267 RepID=UPI0026DEDBCD|nr:capsule biosynthesis protein [Paracoccus sp. (in: a-proteobacteria)]MDO5622478.1 capsule biosynthesis protein [Paracoccus sp. (in: a-proteobacteria)]